MKNHTRQSGSSKKWLLVVITVIVILGSYAIDRYFDYMEHYVELTPGQQEVDGYIHRKIEFAGEKFSTYHPSEFRVEYVNLNLSQPRFMFFHGDVLFIGSKKGSVYRLLPPYHETKLISKLRYYPHSMVVKDNMLYIARSNGIFKTPYSEEPDWTITEEELELVIAVPHFISHGSKTIKLGPDGDIYLSMGWPYNCSNYFADLSYPEELRMGGIFLLDESESTAKLTPISSGLRNPVGFDWHPDTGIIFSTNNGPDHLGYDMPPEYFVKATPGAFFGMPWYQFDGNKLFVDECATFDAPKTMDEVTLPAATFPPHSAPLDVLFINDKANAKDYYGDAIVALHGSWVTESGGAIASTASLRNPKLVRVRFENGDPVEVIDLLSGFQDADGNRWARPAGLALAPDGDIYFTSDDAHRGLFRLKWVD